MGKPVAKTKRGEEILRPQLRRASLFAQNQLGQNDVLGCVKIRQQMMELIHKAEMIAPYRRALITR